MFDTKIVLVNVGNCGGDARPALEAIQNEEFCGHKHLTMYLEEHYDIHPASVSLYSMNDYMDAFNDSDDDAQHIIVDECFMGYVKVEKD